MIRLRVEVGLGPTGDALEECYQLGLKLQIPISFHGPQGSEFEVFPAWASADEVKPGGERIVWKRDIPRVWIRHPKSAST